MFFFNDTATTEIYTLSLHDALPIFGEIERAGDPHALEFARVEGAGHMRRHQSVFVEAVAGEILGVAEIGVNAVGRADRKSTRLNSSHANISYAVFCLKKKTMPYI